MFPWNPSQWTEHYLLSFIGQPESGRLEFKSGKDLAKKENKDKFIRDQLSPAVSAFANSEGGIILIGMDEDRTRKPRVASQLDGIAIGPGNAIESPEQFQQLLDSSISPFLPGLAVRRVPLSGHLQGRVALVVHVPQGSTAYQARDHLYYSRSEFETKSMPDHEVRLRMQRGRVPQAQLELGSLKCITADQEFQKREDIKQEIAREGEAGEFVIMRPGTKFDREVLNAPKRQFDEYEFELAVVNTGELTIRDFVLSVRMQSHDEKWTRAGQHTPLFGIETRDRFLKASDTTMVRPQRKLFPGDRVRFPEQKWILRVASGSTLAADSLTLDWTIFLDDTAPIRGVIDLGVAFQGAPQAGSAD
jgi:hypothetical protein